MRPHTHRISSSPSQVPDVFRATEILSDETGDEGTGDIDPRYINKAYECCRPHPLNHHNPELVEQLKILEKARKLKGEDKNALSYRHAISALIVSFIRLFNFMIMQSYPREIKSVKEASKIVGIGEKIKGRVLFNHFTSPSNYVIDQRVPRTWIHLRSRRDLEFFLVSGC